MKNYREQHLADDWTICPATLRAIVDHCKPGKLVEFGSGIGTKRLSQNFPVLTFEHDPEWIIYTAAAFTDPINRQIFQVHAPIEKGWYSRAKVIEALTAWNKVGPITGVLIDGPPSKIGREGILKNIDIFREFLCPIFLDDTNRPDDMKVAVDLARALERNLSTFDCNDPAKPGVSYSIIEEAK